MPYEGTCKTCRFVVPHELQGIPTGYGYCTKHHSVQLKTPDDAAVIDGTAIVLHGCTCSLGEPQE